MVIITKLITNTIIDRNILQIYISLTFPVFLMLLFGLLDTAGVFRVFEEFFVSVLTSSRLAVLESTCCIWI